MSSGRGAFSKPVGNVVVADRPAGRRRTAAAEPTTASIEAELVLGLSRRRTSQISRTTRPIDDDQLNNTSRRGQHDDRVHSPSPKASRRAPAGAEQRSPGRRTSGRTRGPRRSGRSRRRCRLRAVGVGRDVAEMLGSAGKREPRLERGRRSSTTSRARASHSAGRSFVGHQARRSRGARLRRPSACWRAGRRSSSDLRLRVPA